MAQRVSRMLKEYYQTSGRGFTIVELLIVVVVIAILAAITIIGYSGIQGRANDSSIQADLRQISTKLQAYYIDNGSYPQNTTELEAISLKVSKSAFGRPAEASPGRFNLLYCRPQPTDLTKYALIASSSSGNLYQLVEGSIKTITRTSWDTFNIPSATLCSNAGIPTSVAQIWFYEASTWRPWVGGN